ncbi:hypothetical protein GGS20DRAFT_584351 [Poronia punctata]|nr:hypothetical protein GGS20DRAFT_584351 [Poronia punctata]
MSSQQYSYSKSVASLLPRPTFFLSLAPETSASYPTTQEAFKPAATPARRSSSVSSSNSTAPNLRVLKLGPVHWGEHQSADKTDFSEVAVDDGAVEYHTITHLHFPRA